MDVFQRRGISEEIRWNGTFKFVAAQIYHFLREGVMGSEQSAARPIAA